MSARPLTGRAVFAWIAAGFGLVIAVNGVFMYFALKSWTGLTSANAYNEGIAYNRTLDRAAAQAQLKWRAEMGWSDGAAELRLYDRDGKPVQGLSVVATFARPVQEGFDHSAALTEAGPGRYFATVALPLPGQWNMTIEARHGATSYRAATRVFVP
jgi:nitrogen fixation protein FixH